MDLDDAIGEIDVMSPEQQEDPPLAGWWAVMDRNGIVAYFAHEVDACAFRMMQINMMLNGKQSLEKRGH